MRTGSMQDARSLKMEKEIFMKSKLPWVPTVTKPDSQFIAMLNGKARKGLEGSQKMIEETSQTAIGGGKSKQQRRRKKNET
jgi:hypothetical protein